MTTDTMPPIGDTVVVYEPNDRRARRRGHPIAIVGEVFEHRYRKSGGYFSVRSLFGSAYQEHPAGTTWKSADPEYVRAVLAGHEQVTDGDA